MSLKRMAVGEEPINLRTVSATVGTRALGEIVGTLLGIGLIALLKRIR